MSNGQKIIMPEQQFKQQHTDPISLINELLEAKTKEQMLSIFSKYSKNLNISDLLEISNILSENVDINQIKLHLMSLKSRISIARISSTNQNTSVQQPTSNEFKLPSSEFFREIWTRYRLGLPLFEASLWTKYFLMSGVIPSPYNPSSLSLRRQNSLFIGSWLLRQEYEPIPEWARRLFLSPPSVAENPTGFEATFGYKNLTFSSIDKEGNIGEPSTSPINELLLDLTVSGLGVSKNVIINKLNLTTGYYQKVDAQTSAELDLLFKQDENKIVGRTFVFLENKRWGFAQGYYKDETGWYALNAYMQDGKILYGDAAGYVDLESIRAAANYKKIGPNDLFVTVIEVPQTESSVAIQKTPHYKEAVAEQKVLDKVSVSFGYFETSPGFFASNKINEAKGITFGGGTDAWRGSIYLATEDKDKIKHLNIIGLSAAIQKKTYLSIFLRGNNNGKLTHANTSLSTSFNISDDVELSTSINQIFTDEGKLKTKGSIQLFLGSGQDKSRIGIGYDDVTAQDFFKKTDDLIWRARYVHDIPTLLTQLSNFLEEEIHPRAPYPKYQVEIENNFLGGTLTISNNGISFTHKKTNTNVAVFTENLKNLDKLQFSDLKVALSNNNFSAILDKEGVDVGIKNVDIGSVEIPTIAGQITVGKKGSRLKLLIHQKDHGIGLGAGVVPLTFIVQNERINVNNANIGDSYSQVKVKFGTFEYNISNDSVKFSINTTSIPISGNSIFVFSTSFGGVKDIGGWKLEFGGKLSFLGYKNQRDTNIFLTFGLKQ
ncbi:MAG: hypothetical protein QXN37_01780 [Candidatus Anstonellaceae archaeon]